jgi:UrcA family protein
VSYAVERRSREHITKRSKRFCNQVAIPIIEDIRTPIFLAELAAVERSLGYCSGNLERGKMGSKTLRLTITAFAVIGLALPLAATAAAPSQIDSAAVKVSYDDLNISSEAGARVLYARLQRASERVCGVGSILEMGSLSATHGAKACYEETLDEAVVKIDSEALTSIHES